MQSSWRASIPLIEDVLYNDFAEHDDQRRAVRSFDKTGHVMNLAGTERSCI